MNIFLLYFLWDEGGKKRKKKRWKSQNGFGGCAAPAAAWRWEKLGGDHQKGKLCTAGRKIIVLPQVKNIVALLKSACKASYIIRMFKY